TGTRGAAAASAARATARARRGPARPATRNRAAATCGQAPGGSWHRRPAGLIGWASRNPGTHGEWLWLLPSGPDQVDLAALRGGPPAAILSAAPAAPRPESPEAAASVLCLPDLQEQK